MENQFFTIIIGFVLGIIGSLLIFYYPELLSKNITPLSRTRHKQIYSVVATLGSIVLIYMIEPNNVKEWVQYSFVFLFYIIAWVDGYSTIIPNRLLLILLILASINLWFEPETQKIYAFLSMTIVFLTIYLIGKQFVSKKIVGWGDVKLILVLALMIDWGALLVIYTAIVLAGIVAFVGIMSKNFTKATKIPLTPFLFSGLLINRIIPIDSNLELLFLLN